MIFNKIKKMTFYDYIGVFKIITSFVPALILRFFKKDIWIISEKENSAKDNGFYLYKYIIDNNLRKDCYYAINRKSSDYINKLIDYKNVIQFGSLKHHIYTWASSKNISSEIGAGLPNSNIVFNMYMLGVYKFKTIFLQHGITQNKPDCLYYRNNKIRLFCSACEKEKKFIIDALGYPEKNVRCLGMCRYDMLNDESKDYNFIMLMPTWRSNLVTDNYSKLQEYSEKFLKSEYFMNINGLINSEILIKFLEKNNLRLILKLHDNMQIYSNLFKSKSENVIISDGIDFDIQNLLKNSKYLITDYSSVAFDFAYMKKPLQYFQFDYNEFRKFHLEEGYFNYNIDGFGNITNNLNDCIKEIIKEQKKDFKMNDNYISKVELFFNYTDKNNCERIYQEINKI